MCCRTRVLNHLMADSGDLCLAGRRMDNVWPEGQSLVEAADKKAPGAAIAVPGATWRGRRIQLDRPSAVHPFLMKLHTLHTSRTRPLPCVFPPAAVRTRLVAGANEHEPLGVSRLDHEPNALLEVMSGNLVTELRGVFHLCTLDAPDQVIDLDASHCR
jgi:hypothetical protein